MKIKQHQYNFLLYKYWQIVGKDFNSIIKISHNQLQLSHKHKLSFIYLQEQLCFTYMVLEQFMFQVWRIV